MTQALSSPTALNIEECLVGYIDTVERLARVFHIKVVHGRVHGPHVTEWDDVTRTVRVRYDAPLEDQAWALRQLWDLVTIGPWAADGARPQPALYLVPKPRDGY